MKTVRQHYTPMRMAEIWTTDGMKCWQRCGATGMLKLYLWECKMIHPLWKKTYMVDSSVPTTLQSSITVFVRKQR